MQIAITQELGNLIKIYSKPRQSLGATISEMIIELVHRLKANRIGFKPFLNHISESMERIKAYNSQLNNQFNNTDLPDNQKLIHITITLPSDISIEFKRWSKSGKVTPDTIIIFLIEQYFSRSKEKPSSLHNTLLNNLKTIDNDSNQTNDTRPTNNKMKNNKSTGICFS